MMESQTFSQKTAEEIEIDALEKGKKAAVEIQEETVMLLDDQSGSTHSFLTSPNSLPNSMEGLDEAGGPPPFLKKLLKIVEDPQTDSIISWSDSRESFIVWDNHAFSENILPNYFKHSNFSSFIYQLNTYGFKKMHSDRWEYANEGFQGGKEHLLKTIKRRSKHLQQGGTFKRKRLHSEQSYMEAKLEELKNNLKKMKKEIVKLKQKQESSESNWAAFTKRMASNEHKQQQLRIFLGQIIQLMGEKGELWNGESVKKQRLDPPKSNENLASANQTEKRKNQNQEELIEKVSEANQQVSSLEENEGSPSQEKKTNETSQSLSLALFSGDYYLWEKMLEDELMCENEAQAEAGLATYQFANFLELKDLMTKQPH